MSKLLSILALFRAGSSVADPALWKHGGAALQTAIIAVLLSINRIAGAFGHDLHIDDATAGTIAAGLCAAVGVCVTYITSDKVGLPGLKPVAGQPGDAVASPDQPGPAQVGGIDADTRKAAEVWAQRHANDGGP